MKKKTLAWAIQDDDGTIILVAFSRKEADGLLYAGEKIIRVEISEVKRKRK